jgi:WD40 repeat protein
MTLLIMVLAASGAVLTVADTGPSAPPEDPAVSSATQVPSSGDSLPQGAVARLGTLRFHHGSDLSGVAFALDGQYLLSIGSDGLIRVWDTVSAKERYTIGSGRVHTSCFVVASDGRSLMTFDQDGLFRHWDLVTGLELRRWQPTGVKAYFNSMALSSDGTLLAAAGLNDKAASLWDLENFGQPRRLVGDERSIWDIAFSHDGRMVATAAMDGIPRDFATTGGPRDREKDQERGSVRLWDVEKGTEIARFPVTDSHPRCVAFSPDNTLLAAGFSDATIRLYDTAVGKEITRLKFKGPMQGCLAFSPDGRILASGTHPHRTEGGVPATIRIWEISQSRPTADSWRARSRQT